MTNTRTLTRFERRGGYPYATADGLRHGLYVDVETTSLDPATAKIIEFAMVPFTYDAHGRVLTVEQGMSWFDDPGEPVAPEITAITGISDAMVAGQRLDVDLMRAVIGGSDLVIAHNAEYDRQIVERYVPMAASVPWACSYREVDWRGNFGCGCSKLGHILIDACNEFYDAHRALDDCHVGLHVLASAERGGHTALADLLAVSAQPTCRVWANGAPFGMKTTLKQRGYRWHEGDLRHPKAWYRDLMPDTYAAEVAWLAGRYVRGQVQQFTALDRYSTRAGA